MTVRLAWEKAVIIAPACGRTLAQYDPTRKAIMWEGPKIRALTDIFGLISLHPCVPRQWETAQGYG